MMKPVKKKKVKIFGVPLDMGTDKLGVDMGPNAIRYAGLTQALEFNSIEYEDYGDIPVENTNNNKSGDYKKEIAKISEQLSGLVSEALESGFIPITLGGDHSVSIGSIAGASKKAKRLGIIWLDCHPDANTPDTSPSGNIHGMTIAISLGHGHPELVNCSGFSPKVLPEDIYMIGAKDIDEGEKELLDKLGVKVYTLFDIEKNGIVKIMDDTLKAISKKCDLIHVSFDVDVLDPIVAPGTGILTRGGLSYREISYIMQAIGRKDIVSSIDIIEVNPLIDIKNQTSELAIELLLSALGGSYGDYHRNYLKG